MSRAAQIAIAVSALLGAATVDAQTDASGMKSTGSGNTRYESSQTTPGTANGSQDCNSMPSVRLDTGRVEMGGRHQRHYSGRSKGYLFAPLSVPRWRP